jgi:hypothetical protein
MVNLIFLKRSLFHSLAVICTIHTATAISAERLSDLAADRIGHISRTLLTNQRTLESVRGRDITVFLGNTGSGKSTMINFLSGVPMMVDSDGNFMPEAGRGRVDVRSGGHSCTKFPELVLDSEIGDLCDLPGFQDSNGVVDDLLNAAFIRNTLINARSVRVLVLTTEAELKAVKARPFRNLALFLGLFQNRDFIRECCYLIINRVERAKIPREKAGEGDLIKGAYESLEIGDHRELLLKELMDSKRMFFIPASRCPGTAEESISERDKIVSVYAELVENIGRIRSSCIPSAEVNIGLSFNADTVQTVMMFYNDLMAELFANKKEQIFLNRDDSKKTRRQIGLSQSSEAEKNESWDRFQDQVSRAPAFQILHPLSEQLYRETLTNFRITFEKEYDFYQQMVQVEALRKQTEKAEFEKRIAENQQKKSLEETERVKQKVEELENSKRDAERQAERSAKAVETAQKESLRHRAAMQRAEEAAKQADEEARRAQDSVQQNEVAIKSALNSARLKAEEVERIRKIAQDHEKQQQIAIRRTQQAEEDLKRIESEVSQHRTYSQQMKKYSDQLEKNMKISQRAQQQAERTAKQAEEHLGTIQKSLDSRERKMSRLQQQIEILTREQSDVRTLNQEIDRLLEQIRQKDKLIESLTYRTDSRGNTIIDTTHRTVYDARSCPNFTRGKHCTYCELNIKHYI